MYPAGGLPAGNLQPWRVPLRLSLTCLTGTYDSRCTPCVRLRRLVCLFLRASWSRCLNAPAGRHRCLLTHAYANHAPTRTHAWAFRIPITDTTTTPCHAITNATISTFSEAVLQLSSTTVKTLVLHALTDFHGQVCLCSPLRCFHFCYPVGFSCLSFASRLFV